MRIEPHPYDMPPAERAAWANGRGVGKREADAEIVRLRETLQSVADWIETHGSPLPRDLTARIFAALKPRSAFDQG